MISSDGNDFLDVSIASLVSNRVKAPTHHHAKQKARTIAKPARPLFEGKSIEDALRRSNSDNSLCSQRLRSLMDDDDAISLGSVQNLETVPSVSEGPGILSMISSNFRRRPSMRDQHIGELPNRQQLQTRISMAPIVPTDIQQSSGIFDKIVTKSNNDHKVLVPSPPSTTRRKHPISPGGRSIELTGALRRKASLGLFRGGSLRELMKRSDSVNRQMMALDEDFDDDGDIVGTEPDASSKKESSVLSTQNPPANGTTTQDPISEKRQSLRRPSLQSRNAPSYAIKSPELRKAKDRITIRLQHASIKNERGQSLRKRGTVSTSKTPGQQSTGTPPERSASSSTERSEDSRSNKSPSKSTGSGRSDSISTPSILRSPLHEAAKFDPDASADLEWIPIVQSKNILAPSKAQVAVDSQRGYSSDSERQNGSCRRALRQARWHISKEGQQVQAREKNHQDKLEAVLRQTVHSDGSDDHEQVLQSAVSKESRKEAHRLQKEWHDASGGVTKRKDVASAAAKEGLYNEQKVEKSALFRGKDLSETLPTETRSVSNEVDEGVEFSDSLPSLAAITVQTDEVSLLIDAFSKQHHRKPTHVDILDDSPRVRRKKPVPQRMKLQPDPLVLDESSHIVKSIPPIEAYEWQRITPGSLRHDTHQLYEQPFEHSHSICKSRSPSLLDEQPKNGKNDEHDSLQKSNHTEASSMGESYVMEDVPDVNEENVFDALSYVAKSREPSDREEIIIAQVETVGTLDLSKNEAKTLLKNVTELAEDGAEDKEEEATNMNSKKGQLDWQRIKQLDTEKNTCDSIAGRRTKSKIRGSKGPKKDDRNMKEKPAESEGKEENFGWSSGEVDINGDGEPFLETQNEIKCAVRISSAELGRKSLTVSDEVSRIWSPPEEWQGIKIRRHEKNALRREEQPKQNSIVTVDKGKETSKESKETAIAGLVEHSRTPSVLKSKMKPMQATGKGVLFVEQPSELSEIGRRHADNADSMSPRLEPARSPSGAKGKLSEGKFSLTEESPLEDRPSENLGPFANRPPEVGPFSSRPTGFRFSSQLDVQDDQSTQSVDRHLVRESSHRRLLRKQVADRREALSSIVHATTRHHIQEDDLLDLKRKLALSQALVQKLELEKAEIRREAVMDLARAQMVLLEQRSNREKELESKIRQLMGERNTAVRECHELRILLVGSCELCKKQFEDKKYFMDYYVTNTTLSKQTVSKSSAFEWFTGTLSTEALALETRIFAKGSTAVPESTTQPRSFDSDTASLGATTIPESSIGAPNFQTAPLHWLSDKLFRTKDNDIEDGVPFESIEVEMGRGSTHQDQLQRNSAVGQNLDAENRFDNGMETLLNIKVNSNVSAQSHSDNVQDLFVSGAQNSGMEGTSTAGEQTIHHIHKSQSENGTCFKGTAESDVCRHEPVPMKSDVCRHEPVPMKKSSFFGSLLGEKVADEFAALSLSTRVSMPSNATSKQFSFFGSFKGEKISDDAAYAAIRPSLAVTSEELLLRNAAKTKRGNSFGLKNERVLDDMDLLNVIPSMTENESYMTTTPKTMNGFAGLTDEKFDEEERDAIVLGTSHENVKGATTEISSKGLLRLGNEAAHGKKRDDQRLLDLLAESCVASKNINGQAAGDEVQPGLVTQEDGRVNQGTTDERMLQPTKKRVTNDQWSKQSTTTLSTKEEVTHGMAGSNLTSPFSGKRNKRPVVSIGHNVGNAVPKYLGTYRASNDSQSQTIVSDRGMPASYVTELPTANSSGEVKDEDTPTVVTECFVNSDTTEEAVHAPIDLADRPWREELGKTPNIAASKSDASMFGVETAHHSKSIDKERIDEIEQLASLMDQESSAWD